MDTLRINRVSLDNIGPFTSLDVRFPEKEGLNLVCGDNGIGKTTLLDSIVAAFSQARLERLRRRAGSEKGEILLECIVNGKKVSPKIRITAFEPGQKDLVQGMHNYALSIINIKAVRDFSYSKQDSISRDPAFILASLAKELETG